MTVALENTDLRLAVLYVNQDMQSTHTTHTYLIYIHIQTHTLKHTH